MRFAIAAVLAATVACGGSDPAPSAAGGQAPPPEAEAPVALNPDVPIAYPRALFDQRVEGDVVLRMFLDSTGRLLPESTRVAESSDYPALDSAALAGSSGLRFAPAKRRGIPVATAFLQPVEFRHPGSAGGDVAGPPPAGAVQRPAQPVTPAPRPAAPRPRPPVVRPPADTARAVRPRPDTVPARPDSGRPPADTTRPPADSTRPPADTSAAAR